MNDGVNLAIIYTVLAIGIFLALVISIVVYQYIVRRKLRRRRLLILQMNRMFNRNNENQRNAISQENQRKLEILRQHELKPTIYSNKLNKFRTDCTICLEKYSDSALVIHLPCQHLFHSECLISWINKNIINPKCPNCNYDIIQKRKLTKEEIEIRNYSQEIQRRQDALDLPEIELNERNFSYQIEDDHYNADFMRNQPMYNEINYAGNFRLNIEDLERNPRRNIA